VLPTTRVSSGGVIWSEESGGSGGATVLVPQLHPVNIAAHEAVRSAASARRFRRIP
jgi:hypothetical protein